MTAIVQPDLIEVITSGTLLKPQIEHVVLIPDDAGLAAWLDSDARPPVLLENQHGQLMTVSGDGIMTVLTAGPIAGISNALLAKAFADGTFRETAKTALDAGGVESFDLMLKDRMHAGEIPSDHILLGSMQHRLSTLSRQYHRLAGKNTPTPSLKAMIDEQAHFVLGDLTINVDPDFPFFSQKSFLTSRAFEKALDVEQVKPAFPTPQTLSVWFDLEHLQASEADVEALIENLLPAIRVYIRGNGLSRDALSACQFGRDNQWRSMPSRPFVSLAREEREFSLRPDRKPPMPSSGAILANRRDFFVVRLALPGLGESLLNSDERDRALINPLLDWVSDAAALPGLNLLKCEVTDGLKIALADYQRAQEIKQCVSVHFSTRSAAFAEDSEQLLGVRFREVITVLEGLADDLPEAVRSVRANSKLFESAGHPLFDSNGECIGQLWLCQDPEDLPAVKKGDVSLTFPMSHVDAPDCAMGRDSLRLAVELLRQRGLTDECVHSVPGVLEMQMRAPKGERLNDHIAQRLSALPIVDGSPNSHSSASLIRLAREVNGNPDGTYLGHQITGAEAVSQPQRETYRPR